MISPPLHRSLRNAPAATPVDLDQDGRAVRFDVQLGSITKKMVIDTGAMGLSLPKWIADRLILRREAIESDNAIFTLANGKKETRSGIRVWSGSVGGRTLLDVYATVRPARRRTASRLSCRQSGRAVHHRHHRGPADRGLTGAGGWLPPPSAYARDGG